jgi:dihydrofolate reductase
MGQITVINNVSLDGVMQAPAAPDEDTRGGFTKGGWTNPYQDSVIAEKMGQMMMKGDNGSLLLGRRTYEHLYSVWSKKTDNPYSEHLNKVKKYVVSRTLKEPLPWQNSILLNNDAVAQIGTLRKNTDTNLAILGSGNLIKSLIKPNLIDEFVLLIFPVVFERDFDYFQKEVPLTCA